ncbi:putative aldouronate transport system permease protein [Anaerotaenia torta]|uniref:ABC transporter permease subunit n=1 Tax=Anaerotaenia torta TaxID=433293 RepID=UPI003D1C04EA
MTRVKPVTEPKALNSHVSGRLSVALQLMALLNVVILFLSGLNPARITSYIGKNVSLFTSGISWGILTRNMGRAFNQGWINRSTMAIVFGASMITIIAAILGMVNACLSLGNLKLKNKGIHLALLSGILEVIACTGFLIAYRIAAETDRPDKVNPQFPKAVIIYFIFGLLMLLISVIQLLIQPKASRDMEYKLDAKYKLFLMFLPVIILSFLFSYLPLLGWRYAFFDYKAGGQLSSDNFVGMKWFTQLFLNAATRNDVARVLKNTLAMSGLGILTGWAPMVFAMFLAEISSHKLKRFIQTLTTIPNFISWVLVYAIALSIFSTDGFINTFMSQITGNAYGINYLMDNSHMWLKMLAWGIWKSLGWSAIIYISAISGIDRQLYEASTVDGAGRFQKMWFITVPSLLPTYFVLLLMSIANILSNGMEQYLVFSNPANVNSIEVLDLYVYKLGIGSGAIPLSTVVGMMKSLISVILLFAANRFSKSVRGESIV